MRQYLFVFCLLLTTSWIHAQTRGEAISEMERYVREIKQDEQTIEKNKTRIPQLEADLIRYQEEMESRLEEARNRLTDKEKEIETSESWQNRRETARKGYKEYNPGTCSAGGPPPICVADHWYYVGYSQAMAEYEAYKKRVLDKLRDNITDIDSEYSKKITDTRDEIARMRNEISNLEYELPGKRTKVSNAAYDWLAAARKDNEEKENEWQEAITKEEAYRQVLDHNLGQIQDKQASANGEYLEAFTNSHNRITEKYDQSKDQLQQERNTTQRELNNHDYESRMEADRLQDARDDAQEALEDFERKWRTKELLTEADKQRYQEQKNALTADIEQKSKAHGDYVSQAQTKAAQLRQKLANVDAREKQLDTQYDQAGNTVQEQLKAAFENREKVLNQMESQAKQQIASHSALMRQNKMAREAEVDSWNNQKRDELTRMEGLCSEADAICGSIFTPLSYLPEAEIDIIHEIFEGLPGEGLLEEFADKILRLPKGLPIATYKAGKDGTQTYFESKIGMERFINLKARFEDDPMDPEKGLDTKICLEVLGQDSCIGARTNKKTGREEFYREGVIPESLEFLQYEYKSPEQIMKEMESKTKK